MSITQLRSLVLAFGATYVAACVFFVLLPSRLEPGVGISAAITLVLVGAVNFVIALALGQRARVPHLAGSVLAALLVTITALGLKRGLDNPVRESPAFLDYAGRHMGLGLILTLAIVLASLVGLWIGHSRPGR